MATVEFEIDDALVPMSGVAVLQCFDPDGEVILANLEYGDIRAVETIGLLTAALDQVRYTFIDKDVDPEDFFGEDEDEDEE